MTDNKKPKDDHATRRATALGMGGQAALEKRRQSGVLNARERLALLFDTGSFHETGLFANSIREQDRGRTPTDGKISGYGRIEGRNVAAVANDFTVLGASSSTINSRKIAYTKEIASRNGMPIVFLGESSGGRIPDSMGARGMGASGQDPTQYMRTRETPWASAVLGSCFGSSVWYTCLSDFVVMRRGATLAVASPRVTSLAIGQEVDPEELGGWQLHAEVTGLVDRAVDSDEEAIALIRRFLSYLPSHNGLLSPTASAAGATQRNPAELVPSDRAKVYDMRKVVEAIVDADSFFPLKERFARALITGLARLDGKVVGIIANNPMMKGGALDPDACDKAVNLIVLCDSFNIPIINLVDTPGFLVGIEGERKKAPGKIMNYMQALQLASVPKLSVILRKSYGQAYLNMGGGRNSDEMCAWSGAEISFMDPAIAVNVVYGIRREDDAEKFTALRDQLAADSSAYELAGIFAAQHVIEPQQTRAYLIESLKLHSRARENGIGEHRLSLWPCTY
jgi:acetyl-CoA carboxylase carboxyltransferase component